MWINLARIANIKARSAERNDKTGNDSPSSLQWRKGRTRCHAGTLTKPRSITSEKHRNSNFAGCAERWEKGADYRECMQENSRTYETMESWHRIACGPQKIHRMTPQRRQTQFGNQWYIVENTVGGTNTRPTRQHPELGQAHRTCGLRLHAAGDRKPSSFFQAQ